MHGLGCEMDIKVSMKLSDGAPKTSLTDEEIASLQQMSLDG